MDWSKILGAVLQLIPYAIVGVQHLLPGSSGADKKQAVVNLAGTALAAASIFSPGGQTAAGAIVPSVEPIVQSVFDLISQHQPQALQVHPDNTAPSNPAANAPAPSNVQVEIPVPPAPPQNAG